MIYRLSSRYYYLWGECTEAKRLHLKSFLSRVCLLNSVNFELISLALLWELVKYSRVLRSLHTIAMLFSAGNNSRSLDIVRPNFEKFRPIQWHFDRTRWLNIWSAHHEFFTLLSVNKLYPVQFVKCPTKRKIWKERMKKLFPALLRDIERFHIYL